MDNAYDIPDSTDWLNTPLSQLARVESALRCQVCKDFFDNPVITSCSHTFCSLCIRRCLSTEGKCPACRSGDQELRLRRNWAIQELVDSFKAARPTVLDFARGAAARLAQREEDGEQGDVELPVAKKRKVDNVSEVDKERNASNGLRRTRSQSRRSETERQEIHVEVIEDTDDDGDKDFEPDDGLVACPVCGRRMKNEFVYSHLDRCPGSSQPSSQPPARSKLLGPGPSPSRPLSQRPTPTPSLTPTPTSSDVPKRVPALNYDILKDPALRRKLKEQGIPDWGPRELLKRRHKEWLNLCNANLDGKVQKRRTELLRELDIWERTQGGHAAASGGFGGAGGFGTGNTVMRKDFDKSAWSSAHGDDYKTLIANARRKKEQNVVRAAPSPPPQQPPQQQTTLADDGNEEVVAEGESNSSEQNQNRSQLTPSSSQQEPRGQASADGRRRGIPERGGDGIEWGMQEPDRQRMVEDENGRVWVFSA
ncbi:E3 ubiquitin-protein ligase rad18 [Onygenales sp. PD_40]|nr:E3 ubiquitin-protein ligase rad18 [Onygenales sp. PD_40]